MKLKNIIALAALACASVACASTNYVEVAEKHRNLIVAVQRMSQDPALADPTAFRAALEDLDGAMATGSVSLAWQCVSRRCPLTARAVLARTACFSDRVKGDLLAVCGYDAENAGLGLSAKEAGFVNYILQQTCNDAFPVGQARQFVLSSAIVPARRTLRARGGTFVGKEGGERVKAILDALAAELNAPRFGRAGDILADIGVEVEWDEVESRIPDGGKIGALERQLMDGEIPFSGPLQNKLCIALGVEDYNGFVKQYNGNEKGKRE